jgi:geranylgeranyl pyrophosphate synthase
VNQLILDAYQNDANLPRILKHLNSFIITTVKGEMIDIILPLEEQLSIRQQESLDGLVLKIDAMKTAEYTTIGPLGLGMILGGANEYELDQMKEFSKLLGVVFQIKDDWLNIFGSAEQQGKPCGTDVSEFKMTFLYSEVCKDPQMKRELLKYYGEKYPENKIDKNDLEAVRDIMTKSGAKQRVEERISSYLEECRNMLKGFDFIREEDKEILFGLILFMELRTR